MVIGPVHITVTPDEARSLAGQLGILLAETPVAGST